MAVSVPVKLCALADVSSLPIWIWICPVEARPAQVLANHGVLCGNQAVSQFVDVQQFLPELLELLLILISLPQLDHVQEQGVSLVVGHKPVGKQIGALFVSRNGPLPFLAAGRTVVFLTLPAVEEGVFGVRVNCITAAVAVYAGVTVLVGPGGTLGLQMSLVTVIVAVSSIILRSFCTLSLGHLITDEDVYLWF